ncbi:hypothetical protein FQR65_LT10124 [Abscondita terminalis]|nr:hypothetical protein FQR65_LT10124 [Abscondita terminalis]
MLLIHSSKSRHIASENQLVQRELVAVTTACPCVATAEYNPVCGTDNVTYWNIGRFNCAKTCSPQLEIKYLRACEPYINIVIKV